jgi:hypothetical protein
VAGKTFKLDSVKGTDMVFKIDDTKASIPEISILETVSDYITLDKEHSDLIHVTKGNPSKSHLICMLLLRPLQSMGKTTSCYQGRETGRR